MPRATRLIALAFLVLASTACEAVLPAHSRSAAVNTQSLQVTALSYDKLLALWGSRLDPELVTRLEKAHAAATTSASPGFALSGSGVGMVGEYLASTLRAEADRYSATYGGEGACDDFWRYDGSVRKQNIFGVSFVRMVPGDAEPALAFVFVVLPSADGSAYSVEPALLRVNKCKAKVLSYQAKDWYTTLWTWLLKTGSAVDVSVRVRVDATWMDSDRQSHASTLCDVTIPVGAIDLDQPLDRTKFGGAAAWFPGIPVSAPHGDSPGGTGTFSVNVTMTEKDPSNAANLLEQAADKIQSYASGAAPAHPAGAAVGSKPSTNPFGL